MEKLDLQIGFPFENRMMHWDAAGSGVKCMPLALLKDHQSNEQQSKHSCGCTLPTTNSECSSLQKWEKCPTKQSQEKNHTSIYPPHPLSSPSVPCFSAKRQIDDVREAPLRCRQRMEGGPWLCQLQGQGSLAARAVAPPTMGLPELLMGYSVCVRAFGHLEIVEISAKKCWDFLDLSRHVASLK